jgi:hypothetical protein
MTPRQNPLVIKTVLLFIGICLTAGSWMAHRPAQTEATRGTHIGSTGTEAPAQHQILAADPWPQTDPLSQYEYLRHLTERRRQQPLDPSFCVLAVQPDPAIDRAFLILASSEQAARAFNGYFSFYLNGQNHNHPEQPVLIIDRLFRENSRDQAFEDGTFAEPLVLAELDYWLKTLIDAEKGPLLRDFIVSCYQTDFTGRLQTQAATDTIQNWQRSQTIGDWEVTYYAGRETYCTFRPA